MPLMIQLSRPARARGLKQTFMVRHFRSTLVAPRAGAWIETDDPLSCVLSKSWSRPARARGLKPVKVGLAKGALLGRAPRGRVD